MLEFTFRRAELRDVGRIYNLSNDKLVRKNSIHPENILYEDHVKWFQNLLSDEKYIILVVEQAGSFVGQVKFSIDGSSATISLSLNASRRGQGVGGKIISESVAYISNMRGRLRKIIAYIKKDNVASIRSFEKAGFRYKGLGDVNRISLSRYELNLEGKGL